MDRTARTLHVKALRLEQKGLRGLARRALRSRARHLDGVVSDRSVTMGSLQHAYRQLEPARRGGNGLQKFAALSIQGGLIARGKKVGKKLRSAERHLARTKRRIAQLRE